MSAPSSVIPRGNSESNQNFQSPRRRVRSLSPPPSPPNLQVSDDIVQPARSRSRRERSLVPLIMNPRPITLDDRFSVRKSVGTAEIELHEADNWVIFKEKVRVAMLTILFDQD